MKLKEQNALHFQFTISNAHARTLNILYNLQVCKVSQVLRENHEYH